MSKDSRFSALGTLLALAACAPSAQVETPAYVRADQTTAGVTASHQHNLPKVVIYKSQFCGCCELWAEHMSKAGYPVEIVNTDDLDAIKTRVGLPAGMGSCHTAEVDGYFVEGHVPARDVTRMLVERPAILGLTVPGMPVGSPGMEQGDTVQPYDVVAVAEDGSRSVFAHHGS